MAAVSATGSVLAAASQVGAAAQPAPGGMPAGASPGDWPLFGYDVRSTRFNPHEKTIGPGNAERLKVKWVFDQAKSYSQSTPIVVGGSLFVAAHDGFVYAVDTRSGALKWQFNAWVGFTPGRAAIRSPEINLDPAGEMRGSAGYAGGRIFIGDGTGHLDIESIRDRHG